MVFSVTCVNGMGPRNIVLQYVETDSPPTHALALKTSNLVCFASRVRNSCYILLHTAANRPFMTVQSIKDDCTSYGVRFMYEKYQKYKCSTQCIIVMRKTQDVMFAMLYVLFHVGSSFPKD